MSHTDAAAGEQTQSEDLHIFSDTIPNQPVLAHPSMPDPPALPQTALSAPADQDGAPHEPLPGLPAVAPFTPVHPDLLDAKLSPAPFLVVD